MSRKQLVAVAVIAVVAVAAAAGLMNRDRIEAALFSSEPMERYLEEQIVLEPAVSGIPAEALLSSAVTPEYERLMRWSAIVEILGTKPMAPNGCDIYVRYFAGLRSEASPPPDEPEQAVAGFAVAHVEDPDVPGGPVSWTFPRDGSLWAEDMRSLMPEKYWKDRTGDFADLQAEWVRRVQAEK